MKIRLYIIFNFVFLNKNHFENKYFVNLVHHFENNYFGNLVHHFGLITDPKVIITDFELEVIKAFHSFTLKHK